MYTMKCIIVHLTLVISCLQLNCVNIGTLQTRSIFSKIKNITHLQVCNRNTEEVPCQARRLKTENQSLRRFKNISFCLLSRIDKGYFCSWSSLSSLEPRFILETKCSIRIQSKNFLFSVCISEENCEKYTSLL